LNKWFVIILFTFKYKYYYLFQITTAFLLLLILSCTLKPENPVTFSKSDSLLQIVETEIAQKKRIEQFRRNVLPRNFQEKIENYHPVIRKYAKRYGFDWRLIVAQILKESRFKENARSRVGAVGLMQIMPRTAKEIRQEMDIEYIANNPRENITAGIFHLYKQLRFFPKAKKDEKIKLALASYNSGAGRVLDAQEVAKFLHLNPNHWDSVRLSLPKLSRKNWQLHLEIWDLGEPPRGHFNGYKQTIEYVDDIIKNYTYLTRMY
jgi:membrane-bound lytic murein transglycosylase F